MTTRNGNTSEVYVLRHTSGMLFKDQNLYLGIAVLTDDIDEAAKLELRDAENKLEFMREKDEWKIFQCEIGFRLGEESTRHLVKKRKLELVKELSELDKAYGEQDDDNT